MKRVKTKDLIPEKMITKAQYAKKVGVSQTAINNWIASGKITVVRVQGAELIHED